MLCSKFSPSREINQSISPMWDRLLLCNHMSPSCKRATAMFNSLSQPLTSTQLTKANWRSWAQVDKMPASLFLLSRGHLCKDNIATSKTGMIWVGGGNLKQTIHQERPREGNLEETVEKIRWSDYMHVIGSQQRTASCSRSYWSAVTSLSSLHCRGVSGFWTVRYPTCPSAEPGSSLLCSHSCAWMGNPFISNHDQKIPNTTKQQNQSKKKKSVFLLLLIFGQLAYHHHLSMPQFLTVIGTKVLLWPTTEIFWNLIAISL